ncbi:MAG TPA: Re/Si-specific NAD(P)(+) transhydrogenase subunit alpha [Dehalococcoidia bacterium]|nr:Re/Si-specific NAD(P)(+) transhydrogenase subunit alpha [Dehalococcoidia bacterium]
MIVGVPVESQPDERRVALVPTAIKTLQRLGADVLVERGAGVEAGFADATYEAEGARISADRDEIFTSSDVLVRVRAFAPDEPELRLLHDGQVLVGLLNPLGAPAVVQTLAERGVDAFALELVPRITRAQSMDALTSMATVSGYKAVLMAASATTKMYPLMMTAAGTVTPARVLVVGTGVAGLQAIATARRLGAVVQAYDVRPAAREQVESLGAKFVALELETESAEGAGGYAQMMDDEFYRRQRELMTSLVEESDIVITTAAIPGRPAPVLITEDAVRGMRPGSVIVDLAAETGGNCELTRAGETIDVNGVTVDGPTDLAATIPYDASQMYARNVTAFLGGLLEDGAVRLDLEDEILRETLLTHGGEVVHSRVRDTLGLSTLESTTPGQE